MQLLQHILADNKRRKPRSCVWHIAVREQQRAQHNYQSMDSGKLFFFIEYNPTNGDPKTYLFHFPRTALYWLDAWPAGLKLNAELSRFYANTLIGLIDTWYCEHLSKRPLSSIFLTFTSCLTSTFTVILHNVGFFCFDWGMHASPFATRRYYYFLLDCPLAHRLRADTVGILGGWC